MLGYHGKSSEYIYSHLFQESWNRLFKKFFLNFVATSDGVYVFDVTMRKVPKHFSNSTSLQKKEEDQIPASK